MAIMTGPDLAELAAVCRRLRAKRRAIEADEALRDELIRGSLKAGVPRREIVEITRLSPQRVDQIRRGARL